MFSSARLIAVYAEYLNSYATTYLDGNKVGKMCFPSGEVDITTACRSGNARWVESKRVSGASFRVRMYSFFTANTVPDGCTSGEKGIGFVGRP
jgi:hypothetical protein